MFKKWMKVLTACALFEGISPEELNIVLSCLNPKVSDYDKNELLTVTGERLSGLGIVLAGEVVVAKENAAGNRVIMAVNGPGEMFGEIAAFSEDGVWPASVVARGACSVMLLPAGKIVGNCERSCGSHRLLITNMLNIVSNKALMLTRKVEYLAIRSLRGKISAFLLEQYKKTGKDTFMMPLKRNELADFLNVSRPSLSREMSRMRDEEVIDFHRDSIKIKQVDALRSMAG
ncbi:cAMP-activated global transcriptional regulator CRP [Pelotomaculum sp. FP]|uniref:Crp/Fnr family transcriptional regulator n=1 Tax=Pelotomaculum sp. FP TaxID=261474 RepID=UPI001066766D|nr:Crp/Fnr family transcriptional regulator [Pelotomaculum sp. FP]TEB11507.1 cAMP-activated global transcriptional regulator CRP [Pelotomaculum sp. FP]